MRCLYVLKKWSSAKLSLNWYLSLNKMSLNRDCTVPSLCDTIYACQIENSANGCTSKVNYREIQSSE